MQALSLHFYTVYPNWQNKTTATGFGEDEWFAMLRECLNIERAIHSTEQIMDQVDPAEARSRCSSTSGAPGTHVEPDHPGYGLYQQNSLRDALLAGLTFHIFHEHNDRVRMANIAQTVNVLQSMILTDKETSMLLTPTYYAFEMYKVHQDATRLPLELKSPDYTLEGKSIPALSASASRDKGGVVHVSVVNAHADKAVKLGCELSGIEASGVTGRILTAEKLDAHNTFDDPNQVKPADFGGASVADGKLLAEIPPHSLVVLQLK